MSAKILPFPDVRRRRCLAAAVTWILGELGRSRGTVTEMRAVARRELEQPRDAIRRVWAETFLAETEEAHAS